MGYCYERWDFFSGLKYKVDDSSPEHNDSSSVVVVEIDTL